MKNFFIASIGYLYLKNLKFRNLLQDRAVYLNFLPFLGNKPNLSYQILIYHRILPYNDPFAIGVTTLKNFNNQMEYLSKSFCIVSLSELISQIKTQSLKPNSLCITFDDGYLDNYKYAFPILKKFNIPATIFLTTDSIDSDKILWFDNVLFLIKNVKLSQISFENEIYDLSTLKLKKIAVHSILERLKKYSPVLRDECIDNLRRICHLNEIDSTRLMLNWTEIQEMSNSGIFFGAHTKSHPILSLLNKNDIRKEITESKNIIEDQLNTEIKSFAYPNGARGDFNSACKEVLIQSGFECAVTTIGTSNRMDNDLFELSRFLPWEQNCYAFLGRIIYEKFRNLY